MRHARPALRARILDHDVAVYREGRGPAALLMPAPWGLGAPFLIDAIGPLRKYVTVHSFDPPGVGASPGRASRAPVRDAARYAGALIDALGLEDVVLVAHGVGTAAAARLLATAPPRVARAVLVAPLARPGHAARVPEDAAEAARAAAFRDAWSRCGAREDVDAAASVLDALPGVFAMEDGGAELVLEELVKREDPRTVARLLHATQNESVDLNVETELSRIRVPTWVVAGKEDTVTPVEASREVGSLVPHAWFSAYAGASHMPFFEKAAVFHRHMRGFVHDGEPPRSAARSAGA